MPIKVRQIIREEWSVIFKNPRTIIMLLFIPVLYTALFGYLYVHGRVTEIQTVVFDEDNSQLSRQIVQAFDTSEIFNVTKQARSEQEAEDIIKQGEAKVALIVPDGFSARIKHGDMLPVMTLIDGSNMMISNTATRAANEVVATFSAGISAKKLQMQGLQDEQISATFSAIPFRYRVLFNPTFNYSDFMVYGTVSTALQQVLLLGISMSLTREKEEGTWARLAVWKHTPWRMAIAKSAPYFLIGLFNTAAALVVGVYGFRLPFHGTMTALLALSVSFTFAVVGLGYLASLFSKRSLDATQVTMLIAMPSFLLSGYTWPFEVMPKPLVFVSHGIPLTYFLDGIRKVLVKGNGYEAIWRDVYTLGLYGLITYFAAFLLTRFVMFSRVKEDQTSKTHTKTLPLPASDGGSSKGVTV